METFQAKANTAKAAPTPKTNQHPDSKTNQSNSDKKISNKVPHHNNKAQV